MCENLGSPVVEAGLSRASCWNQGAGLKAAVTKSGPSEGFHTDFGALPFQRPEVTFFSSPAGVRVCREAAKALAGPSALAISGTGEYAGRIERPRSVRLKGAGRAERAHLAGTFCSWRLR